MGPEPPTSAGPRAIGSRPPRAWQPSAGARNTSAGGHGHQPGSARSGPCGWGHLKLKKRRRFDQGHAQRWRYGAKATPPGERVQIDHLSVSLDGVQLQEFRAVSPVGKHRVTRLYSRATARNARRFLQVVIQDLPFPLHSVQVDGGSEFMAEFESACQPLDIPPFVLPPRRPQFNGCVERANDSARVEFWNLYTGELTVAAAGTALADYQHFYNYIRPHRSPDLRTPMVGMANDPSCVPKIPYLRHYRFGLSRELLSRAS